MWKVAAIAAAFAAVGAGRWWFGERRALRRAFGQARRVDVADAVEGELVQIVGTLEYAGETARAPFSPSLIGAWRK